MPPMTQELLDDMFRHHPVVGDQQERYNAVNEAAKHLAQTIFDNCPACADTTHAIRQVRDGRMWANQAIAIKGAI